jgi:hypothetical protein
MGAHGHPEYVTGQGESVPTSSWISLDQPSTLGFWFRLDEPRRLVGFRYYAKEGTRDVAAFSLWADDELTLLQTGVESDRLGMSVQMVDAWKNCYTRPQHVLPSGVDMLFGVTKIGWTKTTTDALSLAGVDVGPLHILGGADGREGRYSIPGFLNNPPLSNSGHLYGVDVILGVVY